MSLTVPFRLQINSSGAVPKSSAGVFAAALARMSNQSAKPFAFPQTYKSLSANSTSRRLTTAGAAFSAGNFAQTRIANGGSHAAKTVKESAILQNRFGFARFAAGVGEGLVGSYNLKQALTQREAALRTGNSFAINEATRAIVTNGALTGRGMADIAVGLHGTAKMLGAEKLASKLAFSNQGRASVRSAVGLSYLADGAMKLWGADERRRNGLSSKHRYQAEMISGTARGLLGLATTTAKTAPIAYPLSAALALAEAAFAARRDKPVDFIADAAEAMLSL